MTGRKFEVGKRYADEEGGNAFTVIRRTDATITVKYDGLTSNVFTRRVCHLFGDETNDESFVEYHKPISAYARPLRLSGERNDDTK